MKNGLKNSIRTFIVSVLILAAVPEEWTDRLEALLFHSPITLRRLQMLWHVNPTNCILILLYLLVVATAVVSFFRMITLLAKTRRGSGVQPSGSKAKNTLPRENTGVPIPTRKAVPTRVKQGTRKEDHTEADEAIHCAHLRGKEKYLEQIDGFLRTGLIGKEEYRILKERYSKLDIPDDYH